MDKYTLRFYICLAAFMVFAAAAMIAGPEHPGLRIVLIACAVATVPFSLINSWESVPARNARRARKTAPPSE